MNVKFEIVINWIAEWNSNDTNYFTIYWHKLHNRADVKIVKSSSKWKKKKVNLTNAIIMPAETKNKMNEGEKIFYNITKCKQIL